MTARNNDGYEGQTIALSEAEDFAELVKQMRADLGDEPIAVYERKMAEIGVARAEPALQARASGQMVADRKRHALPTARVHEPPNRPCAPVGILPSRDRVGGGHEHAGPPKATMVGS